MWTPHSSWLTSLTFCPSPGAVPTWGALRAIASSSGRTRSTAGRAADHDEQVSGAGAGGPTGDRGVDQLHLLLAQPLGPPLDGGGPTVAITTTVAPGASAVGRRVVAEEHALDLVGGGDHDDPARPPRGRLADRRRRLHPVGGQRLGAGGVDVVGGHVESGAGHDPAMGSPSRPGPIHPTRVTVTVAVLPRNRSIT
jgi:hypothetical protein